MEKKRKNCVEIKWPWQGRSLNNCVHKKRSDECIDTYILSEEVYRNARKKKNQIIAERLSLCFKSKCKYHTINVSSHLRKHKTVIASSLFIICDGNRSFLKLY